MLRRYLLCHYVRAILVFVLKVVEKFAVFSSINLKPLSCVLQKLEHRNIAAKATSDYTSLGEGKKMSEKEEKRS